MALTTFSPSTQIKSSEVNANFTGLSDGSNDTTANSLITFRDEYLTDAVISGGVISADSAGVNRNASMTAMVAQVNGRRLSIAAVTARTYTASKDTYVDLLDNLDGTGTLVYTEVANGAAAPALAANSIRLAKVVTGATTIAAASSILQGYMDSLLNFIFPRPIGFKVTDTNGWTAVYQGQQIIYRKRVTFSQALTSGALTGLSMSANTFPVGMATVSTTLMAVSMVTNGFAGEMQWDPEMSTASVILNVTVITSASRTYSGFLDWQFITP